MDVDGTLIRQEGINLLAQAADMGEKKWQRSQQVQ